MSTTIYNDYYTNNVAISKSNATFKAKTFKIALISEDYIPDPAHKPNDAVPYIIINLATLTGAQIVNNTMSDIVDLMKTKVFTVLQNNPDLIRDRLNYMMPNNTEKVQRIMMLITNPPTEGDLWRTLKEQGVKYCGVGTNTYLCFCEEL